MDHIIPHLYAADELEILQREAHYNEVDVKRSRCNSGKSVIAVTLHVN